MTMTTSLPRKSWSAGNGFWNAKIRGFGVSQPVTYYVFTEAVCGRCDHAVIFYIMVRAHHSNLKHLRAIKHHQLWTNFDLRFFYLSVSLKRLRLCCGFDVFDIDRFIGIHVWRFKIRLLFLRILVLILAFQNPLPALQDFPGSDLVILRLKSC